MCVLDFVTYVCFCPFARNCFELTYQDALNRFPDHENTDHTTRLLKYIFPRQFGLHNVFTSSVDRKETAHPFKDYTLREQEISIKGRRDQLRHNSSPQKQVQSLPKRLRGQVFHLVRRMQLYNSRCAYSELLSHYCPVEVSIGCGTEGIPGHSC